VAEKRARNTSAQEECLYLKYKLEQPQKGEKKEEKRKEKRNEKKREKKRRERVQAERTINVRSESVALKRAF